MQAGSLDSASLIELAASELPALEEASWTPVTPQVQFAADDNGSTVIVAASAPAPVAPKGF
jgi:hypothetical protein